MSNFSSSSEIRLIMIVIGILISLTQACEMHDRLAALNATLLEMREDVAVIQRCNEPTQTIVERYRQSADSAARFNSLTMSFVSRIAPNRTNVGMRSLGNMLLGGLRVGPPSLHGIGAYNYRRSIPDFAEELRSFTLAIVDLINAWEQFLSQDRAKYCVNETISRHELMRGANETTTSNSVSNIGISNVSSPSNLTDILKN